MSDAVLRSNDEMPEDPQASRKEFRRRMAEQGMIVRLPRPGVGWTPSTLPIPFTGNELSAMVVRLRRGSFVART
jgi:hypothetical protein